MKVALVGDFSPNRDEGLKNIGHDLADRLERACEVHRFDLTKIRSPAQWKALRAQRPDIVHYVTGNTIRSLGIAKVLSRISGAAPILSCPHPNYSWLYRNAPPLARLIAQALRPRLVIVQSPMTRTHFERAGIPATILPNGIDTDRFKPANPEERSALRKALGLPEDARIALHVGHLRKSRNLHVMAKLAKLGFHSLVVASERMPREYGVRTMLEAAGVEVRLGYHPAIERYYQACNVYVFPVGREDTIQTPLSVLESLACGLPVATRRFDGLDELFEPSREGYVPCDNEVSLVDAAIHLGEHGRHEVARKLGEQASLERVADQHLRIYKEVLG